jgi:hypothetical protein
MTSYELDDQGLISSRGRNISFRHCIQTRSGANPASYSVGIRVFYTPGVKQLECKANHLPLFSAEWNYTSAIICPFAVALSW